MITIIILENDGHAWLIDGIPSFPNSIQFIQNLPRLVEEDQWRRKEEVKESGGKRKTGLLTLNFLFCIQRKETNVN